jgi:hypothetical protein
MIYALLRANSKPLVSPLILLGIISQQIFYGFVHSSSRVCCIPGRYELWRLRDVNRETLRYTISDQKYTAAPVLCANFKPSV